LTNREKVFIIDEIDRSLHPQLTYRFIKYFLHLATNRNVQLIVTTHESRLLDFDLLRQDEIWLSEKDKEGATNLYSLDEYNVRFDRKVDKAYLEGRYGGVPIFTTLFPLEE
jgi:AAA15 family ATPase/GTPase